MNILKNDIYIILVNYGHAKLTVDCITSLNKAGCNNDRIIIVDNNSPDDSLEILRMLDGVILIESKENGGFSYGNNLGIKYALSRNCEGVVLLNNDTVISEDFFEHFISTNCDEVVVPKILYYDHPDVIWYAGGEIRYDKGLPIHHGMNQKDSMEFSGKKYTDYACGCCILIPRSILDRIGLLNEKYFMYWEDCDYTLRLFKAGLKISYMPEAKVWHKVSMSSDANSPAYIYYFNRNRFYVLKHYNFGLSAWIYTVLTRLIRVLMSFFYKSNDRMIIKAWKDYRKGIMGKIEL